MKNLILFASFFTLLLFSEESSSNIAIKNTGSTARSLKGIYLQKISTGSACDPLVGEATTPANGLSIGALWTPVSLTPGKSYNLGSSALYQMMSQMLYPVYILAPIGGSKCTPGEGKCTAGDAPNTNQWCINLGVTTGTTVAPTQLIGAGDLIQLVDSLEIKITCDDSTARCFANTTTIQNLN